MSDNNVTRPPLPGILASRRVAILGAGTVGQALGALLREAGLAPVAVTAREGEHASAAALVTGGEPLTDNADAASRADLLLLTVGDDQIAHVAEQVATAVRPGAIAAHASGALGLDALGALRDAGASVGSIHPLQSFASVSHAVRELPGSVFGVTADPDARATLEALVTVVGGVPVPVAEDARPLYHAAAVLASNCFVSLEDIACRLLVTAGFDEQFANKALEPLMRGTASNIRRLGTEAALTGPVVRGDIGTVRAHLTALADAAPDALPVYQALGSHAAIMAWERHAIDRETFDVLRSLLRGDPDSSL